MVQAKETGHTRPKAPGVARPARDREKRVGKSTRLVVIANDQAQGLPHMFYADSGRVGRQPKTRPHRDAAALRFHQQKTHLLKGGACVQKAQTHPSGFSCLCVNTDIDAYQTVDLLPSRLSLSALVLHQICPKIFRSSGSRASVASPYRRSGISPCPEGWLHLAQATGTRLFTMFNPIIARA